MNSTVVYKSSKSIQLTVAALGLFVAVLGGTLLEVTSVSHTQAKAIVYSQQQIAISKDQITTALDSIVVLSRNTEANAQIIKLLIAEVVRLRNLVTSLGGDPGPILNLPQNSPTPSATAKPTQTPNPTSTPNRSTK